MTYSIIIDAETNRLIASQNYYKLSDIQKTHKNKSIIFINPNKESVTWTSKVLITWCRAGPVNRADSFV
jgi:hypothetical protein